MLSIISIALSLTTMTSPIPSTNLNLLFDRFDLTRPELAEVQRLATAGDAPAAASALARYYQKRSYADYPGVVFGDSWSSPATDNLALRDNPQDVMNFTFAFLAEKVQLQEGFDWCDQFIPGEPESTWWINRFFYLIVLDEETEKTGDTKYVRRGVELMLDWVKDNPAELAKERDGAWRSLEVGLRMGNWVRFMARQIPKGNIHPDEIPVLLNSLWEQADYISRVSGPGRGNWGFMEQSGLGLVALTFPEFEQSRIWTSSVLANMDRDIASQIYPDGSHEEMSPHYEMTVIHSVLKTLELARQENVTVPQSLQDAVKRMVNYIVFTLKPDRTLPMKNDGDAYDLTPFLTYISRKFNLPEALWVVTEGKEGSQPGTASMAFPYSGLRLFKSTHDSHSFFLLFDDGPFGTSHQHEDKLSIDVSAYGRHFIVDPGRYIYPDCPLRRYFLSTLSHATIMVDGLSQREREEQRTWRPDGPNPDPWLTSNIIVFAEGSYTSGYGEMRDIVHRRRILSVRDEFWLIEDIVEGTGQHHVDLNFQFTPGDLIPYKSGSYTTQFPDANLLLVHASNPVLQGRIRTGQENPPIGWYSQAYGLVEPAPHLQLSATAELPFKAYTLLLPYRGDRAPDAEISIETVTAASECRASGLRILYGDFDNWILLSEAQDKEKSKAVKSFGGYEFTSALAWIKTSRNNQVLVTDTAGGTGTIPVALHSSFPLKSR